MHLYFKPGACSLAARITLIELGLPFAAVPVDTAKGTTATGADYKRINPKGYVPALAISPGVVITENPAILQYLADLAPERGLAPPAGGLERVRLQEWLAFISSELHKAFAPWFSGRPMSADDKARAEAHLARRLDDVERQLADGRTYLLGEGFTVADAYLFAVLNWTRFIGVSLEAWPYAARFVEQAQARSAVREALIEEGLSPAGDAA
ncbi:glutathione S-transferase C-terminal domain-containing protein [Caulobacter sp. SL161]|uniref:glutathione S-transferase C-terminal domain-containing protein n=1 Tax=Caulobacter sp. SL161 TaxID=2995156 RepID=UPI0022749972|nr:glutathione S-transferase C-terminal domain-containing protein [Caulobacter sp. SL161]MCY1648877.1 glutathione S-transferase C-terminal domain-containing protein [Caulobacter sp. SL161]